MFYPCLWVDPRLVHSLVISFAAVYCSPYCLWRKWCCHIQKEVINLWSRLAYLNPMNSLVVGGLVKQACKNLCTQEKEIGKRRSPCCRPLLGKMGPWGAPLTKIKRETNLTQNITKHLNLKLKPIIIKTWSENSHSILSRLFSYLT